MEPVKKSTFASYFDDLSELDTKGVNILSAAEAMEVWTELFGHKAKGLYDLPATSWVVKGSWLPIGTWIDAYNGLVDRNVVINLVATASNWASNEPLWFVQSSRQIVALELQGFLKCWHGLFAAFDDGPILVTRGAGRDVCAMRFVPMGQIMLMKSENVTPLPRGDSPGVGEFPRGQFPRGRN